MRLHYQYFFIAVLVVLSALPFSASAQTIIRDTEIEEAMQEWFAPIFEAASIEPEQVKIILVQDPQINAFVAEGANIFFFTGLLQKTDSPGEVIGVMAHELGHITGGHLTRGREALRQASYQSILGMIIGIGAAAATGEGGAAAAIGTGTSSMAQRQFLATSRVYESSADQAALSTMERAQINPTGFLTFLQKLEGQELLPASQQSEYVRTHPLTRNRVDTVAHNIESSAYKDTALPAHWHEQHARMKAKLLGFIRPEQVPWVYDDRDTSIAAIYARAIAAYRQNKVDTALAETEKLITKEPDNPYFYELKGQMLFEFGRAQDSIAPYQKALEIKPDAALFRIGLGHAQLETAGNDPAKLKAAILTLQKALQDEPRSSKSHRLLATAYGRMGLDPMARLHLAEEALLQRKTSYAKQQAEVALKGLQENTPEWLRAQDILNFIENRKG